MPMRTIICTIFLICPLLATSSGFRMGDRLMTLGKFDDALKEYQKALQSNPDDPQALWRVGAALTRIAIGDIGNSRHENLEEATNKINRAIVKDPKITEAHLEYARALGYLALFKPDWDDVRVARRVREELRIVLSSNANNSDANYLLGLWHRWVGPVPMIKRMPNGLGEASVDSCLFYFRKAANLDKGNLEYEFELARAYRFTDNNGAAKEILRRLANLKDYPLKYENIPKKAAEELEILEKTGSGE